MTRKLNPEVNFHRGLALAAALVLFVLVAFVYSTRAAASVVWITQSGAGAATGVDLADAAPVSFVESSGNCGSGSTQIGAGTIVRFSGTFTFAAGANGAVVPVCGGSGTGANRVFYESDPVNGALFTSPQFGNGAGSTPAGAIYFNLSHVYIGGTVPCGTTQGGVDQTNACNFVIQNTASGTAFNVGPYNNGQSGLLAPAGTDIEVANIDAHNAYVRLPNWSLSSVSFSGSTGTVSCSASCPVGQNIRIYIYGNTAVPSSTLLTVTANNSGGSTFTVSGGPTSGSASGGVAVDETNNTSGNDVSHYWSIQSGVNGLLVHDSVFHDGGWLLNTQETGAETGNPLQLYNLQIYRMDHGIAMTPQAAANTGPIVHDNHIHDMTNWDDTTIITNGDGPNKNHHDGLHWEEDLTHNPQYSYTSSAIYNNQFDGDPGQASYWMFLRASSTSQAVFNNVFVCTPTRHLNIMGLGDYGSGVGPSFTTNPQVYNNTTNCIGGYANGGASIGVPNSGGNADVTGADWRNNILQGQQFVIGLGVENSSVFTAAAPDYNVYGYNYADSGDTLGVWMFTTIGTGAFSTNCLRANYPLSCSGSESWATYVATLGSTAADAHSLVATNAALNLQNDGTPGSGAPEVGAGTNLTSLCSGVLAPLCQDKKGHARPTTGPWDLGAVNFAASVALPPVSSRTLQ